MKDFLMVQAESLDEVIYNAMILFKNSDLGGKIETSLNRELKKDVANPVFGKNKDFHGTRHSSNCRRTDSNTSPTEIWVKHNRGSSERHVPL